MTEYVVSQKKAMRLKEAGFPQETEFYWVKWKGEYNSGWNLISKRRLSIEHKKLLSGQTQCYKIISAPLTDEILKWLPPYIDEADNVYSLEIYKTAKKQYIVAYPETMDKIFWKNYEAREDTLPDALAMMVIELGKEGLL